MMFTVSGFTGYIIITLTMLAKTFGWTSNYIIVGIAVLAGFICIGIAENQFGYRHRVVRTIDYLPLMVLGVLYAFAPMAQIEWFYIALLFPFGAISAVVSRYLTRNPRFRNQPSNPMFAMGKQQPQHPNHVNHPHDDQR
ncbi:permease [Paenibacillus sp. 481]|uniref:permease n=1 Tax=Paenibacillus sp. 481 TaxID=2835869 RepID=UPI001E59599C|nr:permease [Paenibacillus sp. 481]UHA71947.1 permease [Paenibacillus sp. 481]